MQASIRPHIQLRLRTNATLLVFFFFFVLSSAHAKGVVFTRWGSRFCPPNTIKLYDGIMAGEQRAHRGGGINYLCMHPEPQFPANYSDNDQKSNELYGVEYMDTGALDNRHSQDAACVVCQHKTAKSVYVQWGRVSCSNGHVTQYSGLIMASGAKFYKMESICVDLERAVHSTSNSALTSSAKLFTTEFVSSEKATDDQVYTDYREVACAVCSPLEFPSAPTCQNARGWTDLYGDDCSTPFYSTGCIPEDTVPHANKLGVSAKDACCACGGGERRENVPSPPPGGCPSYNCFCGTQPANFFYNFCRRLAMEWLPAWRAHTHTHTHTH